MKLTLQEFENKIRLFGCDKPGGRPLNPARAKELGVANVCIVKRKDGRMIAYKRKDAHKAEDSGEVKDLKTGKVRSHVHTEKTADEFNEKFRAVMEHLDEEDIVPKLKEIREKAAKVVQPETFVKAKKGLQKKAKKKQVEEGVGSLSLSPVEGGRQNLLDVGGQFIKVYSKFRLTDGQYKRLLQGAQKINADMEEKGSLLGHMHSLEKKYSFEKAQKAVWGSKFKDRKLKQEEAESFINGVNELGLGIKFTAEEGISLAVALKVQWTSQLFSKLGKIPNLKAVDLSSQVLETFNQNKSQGKEASAFYSRDQEKIILPSNSNNFMIEDGLLLHEIYHAQSWEKRYKYGDILAGTIHSWAKGKQQVWETNTGKFRDISPEEETEIRQFVPFLQKYFSIAENGDETPKNTMKFVSDYAKTNSSEFLSDSFAAYVADSERFNQIYTPEERKEFEDAFQVFLGSDPQELQKMVRENSMSEENKRVSQAIIEEFNKG